MTTPRKQKNYKPYSCPTCGVPRHDNDGQCKDCWNKSRRKSTKPIGGICTGCGKKIDRRNYKCRECFMAGKAIHPRPNCIDCGVPVCRKRCQRCNSCNNKWRAANPDKWRVLHKCKECQAPLPRKSPTGWCRPCANRLRGTDYSERVHSWNEQRKQFKFKELNEAAKLCRKQKRCPTCGGKITTKSCVKCVVLGKIGEKGFV